MKNGYKILWTDFALKELENTIEYLEENWTEKEMQNLAVNIEETLILISQNPDLFQVSEVKKDIKRVVILNSIIQCIIELRIIKLKLFHFSQIGKIRKKGN